MGTTLITFVIISFVSNAGIFTLRMFIVRIIERKRWIDQAAIMGLGWKTGFDRRGGQSRGRQVAASMNSVTVVLILILGVSMVMRRSPVFRRVQI